MGWAAVVMCAVTCIGLTPSLVHLGNQMHVRAHDWERQDAWIRARVAHGARVVPYTPTPIAVMSEPFGNGKRSWVTKCVARYYDVKRVDYSPALP